MKKKSIKQNSADLEQRLAALGAAIADKRKEAVDARKGSGIESIWLSCEEAYLGVDDMNRHEYSNAKWSKATTMQGPLVENLPRREDHRSTAFVRLTSRYVDAGAAKLCEIALPIDDKPFKFDPTPVPDLVMNKDDLRQIVHPQLGPLMRERRPEDAPFNPDQAQQAAPQPPAAPQAMPAQQPGQAAPQAAQAPAGPAGGQQGAQQPGFGLQPPGAATETHVPLTAADLFQEKMSKAQEASDKAERRIYDWMVECNYPAEIRKVAHDAARMGVGILKAPYFDVQTNKAMSKTDKGVALQIVRKVVPAAKWIDPWNFFPDPACGENIQHGDYVLERDFVSAKILREMKGRSGVLSSQIDQVLSEGPGKCNMEEEGAGRGPNKVINKNRYERWTFTGTLTAEEMGIVKDAGVEDLPDELKDCYCICTMVNDTVVKVIVNPLESGEYPYHALSWSRRAGYWAGVGLAEQVSMPQRMVNAATRALLNNAGVSSGAQIVVDRNCIEPADGRWALTPNKIWYMSAEVGSDDVRKAFFATEIPNVGAAMQNIINYGFKLAEEATNLPLMAQGQPTERMPDTFGAAELLNDNANTLFRALGYAIDDCITEPVVKQFYEILLLDPDIPDDEKGDFKINAHGSIAMVERGIQEQVMVQLLSMTANPAFGIDPKKAFAEWMKSKRLDPNKVQYSKEEQEKLASAPPQPPIQIAVEQLKGQNAQALKQMEGQQELQRIAAEAQAEQQQLAQGGASPHIVNASAKLEQERIRAEASAQIQESRAQAELARAEKEKEIAAQNGQFRLAELQMQRELELLKYANEQKLSLDNVRTQLAKAAIDSQTKRDLSAAEIQLVQSEGHNDRALELTKHHYMRQNIDTQDGIPK